MRAIQNGARFFIALAMFAIMVADAKAGSVVYDLRTAIEASVNGFSPVPSVWSASALAQTGQGGFWYRWKSDVNDNPLDGNEKTNWWEELAPASLTFKAAGPTAYPLLGFAANDTRGYKHGWVYVDVPITFPLIGNIHWDESDGNNENDEVRFRVTNDSQQGGFPLMLEWLATADGLYSANFVLRDPTTGLTPRWQAHLLTWDVSAGAWGNHTYVSRVGAGSESLTLPTTTLSSGDSIVLYLTMLNDAFGSQSPYVSGNVTSFSIPTGTVFKIE